MYFPSTIWISVPIGQRSWILTDRYKFGQTFVADSRRFPLRSDVRPGPMWSLQNQNDRFQIHQKMIYSF